MFLDYLKFNPLFEADGKGGGAEPQPSDDPNPGDDKAKEDPKKDEPKTDPKTEKKYSDKELDEIIGKKFAKWKADEERKLEEAKKLAGMSAAEKLEHQMTEAVKRAEEAEAKLSHMSMTREARAILAEKNISLSDDLLEILVGDDAETTKSNIDEFADLFDKAVETAVKKALRGKTPKSGGSKTTMTKDEISQIKDPVARRKAIRENIALYE